MEELALSAAIGWRGFPFTRSNSIVSCRQTELTWLLPFGVPVFRKRSEVRESFLSLYWIDNVDRGAHFLQILERKTLKIRHDPLLQSLAVIILCHHIGNSPIHVLKNGNLDRAWRQAFNEELDSRHRSRKMNLSGNSIAND
ncbi:MULTISPECIES: hypothetical protein [unclassified Rhizobium]|uniref:hypothetical protein n=1 Tax=unclassified Rhizobium TaxID=2613769 RepID=UPI001ADA789F|nr:MULTISPECIES: hypothetical protein [unclassified Rhizobium]MBO9127797.1 hypothetical protein [Rhizobium sp. 16-488-2b]MBO9178259.1 hypothetical protein [Rhizobium sp. 16-488-2a]